MCSRKFENGLTNEEFLLKNILEQTDLYIVNNYPMTQSKPIYNIKD